MSVAIHRKINARNLVLEEGQAGQTIGVRRRDGSYAYLSWGGFLDVEVAKALPGAVPVKLQAARVGTGQEWAMTWNDVGPGQHVQGCKFQDKAYAVLQEGRFRLV
jgi:hypothetical protein